jgi:hypothetical protein
MENITTKTRRHEAKTQMGAIAILLCLFFAYSVKASVTSALISKALDSQQKLDLNATLPQAMEQIGKITGVRIEADPVVWDLLPWGEQTTIAAKIENQTLRQDLSAITRKLGLEFEVGDETVELRPMPALRRLGRRATVQELQALDQLASTPIHLSGDRATVHEILAAIDAQLQGGPLGMAIENRAWDSLQDVHVGVARNATLSDALEDLSTQTTATWYPWGKRLVIVPKRQQIRDQLAKTLTARYNGVDVSQVVLELLQRAGVDFIVEPGAYQHIPAEHRNVRLMLDNATVQQALETIGGYTGLEFEVTDSGVRVANQSAPATQNAER